MNTSMSQPKKKHKLQKKILKLVKYIIKQVKNIVEGKCSTKTKYLFISY